MWSFLTCHSPKCQWPTHLQSLLCSRGNLQPSTWAGSTDTPINSSCIRIQNVADSLLITIHTLCKSCHQLKATSCSQVNSSSFQLITVQKRASTGSIRALSYMPNFHRPASQLKAIELFQSLFGTLWVWELQVGKIQIQKSCQWCLAALITCNIHSYTNTKRNSSCQATLNVIHIFCHNQTQARQNIYFLLCRGMYFCWS